VSAPRLIPREVLFGSIELLDAPPRREGNRVIMRGRTVKRAEDGRVTSDETYDVGVALVLSEKRWEANDELYSILGDYAGLDRPRPPQLGCWRWAGVVFLVSLVCVAINSADAEGRTLKAAGHNFNRWILECNPTNLSDPIEKISISDFSPQPRKGRVSVDSFSLFGIDLEDVHRIKFERPSRFNNDISVIVDMIARHGWRLISNGVSAPDTGNESWCSSIVRIGDRNFVNRCGLTSLRSVGLQLIQIKPAHIDERALDVDDGFSLYGRRFGGGSRGIGRNSSRLVSSDKKDNLSNGDNAEHAGKYGEYERIEGNRVFERPVPDVLPTGFWMLLLGGFLGGVCCAGIIILCLWKWLR
jgi:hypothetical protein